MDDKNKENEVTKKILLSDVIIMWAGVLCELIITIITFDKMLVRTRIAFIVLILAMTLIFIDCTWAYIEQKRKKKEIKKTLGKNNREMCRTLMVLISSILLIGLSVYFIIFRGC